VRVGKRPQGIHVGLSRFRPRGCRSKRPIAAPTIKNVCAVPRAVEGHRRFALFGQNAKLTFGTWHLIVSFWLLSALSPYAAVRAQIPPANSSASSLDLTMHVHPDWPTAISEKKANRRPKATRAPLLRASRPRHPSAVLLLPLQKPARLQLAELLNTRKASTKKFTGARSLNSRWDFSYSSTPSGLPTTAMRAIFFGTNPSGKTTSTRFNTSR